VIIYSIWCEWDIGINQNLYTNQNLAIKEAKAALENSGIEESYEVLLEDGYIGLEPMEVKGSIHVLVPNNDHSFYGAVLGYEDVVEDPGGDFWEFHEGETVPEGGDVFKALVAR